MNKEDHVAKFHTAFNLELAEEPSLELLQLRKTLIQEEVAELFEEIDIAITLLKSNTEIPKELFVKILKEMADVQCVLSGTAVALAPLQRFHEAFERVIESNMSKLDAEGKAIKREDGKVLKGPNYFEPQLDDLVE